MKKLANPDAKYAETSEGKTFEAKEQKARYIRIYTRGSILTSGTAHGGNHICELEVYGKAIKSTATQKKYTVAFDKRWKQHFFTEKVSAGENFTMPQKSNQSRICIQGLVQRCKLHSSIYSSITGKCRSDTVCKMGGRSDHKCTVRRSKSSTEQQDRRSKKTKQKGDYSDASWNAFQNALAAAKEAASKTASAADVRKALDSLKKQRI